MVFSASGCLQCKVLREIQLTSGDWDVIPKPVSFFSLLMSVLGQSVSRLPGVRHGCIQLGFAVEFDEWVVRMVC